MRQAGATINLRLAHADQLGFGLHGHLVAIDRAGADEQRDADQNEADAKVQCEWSSQRLSCFTNARDRPVVWTQPGLTSKKVTPSQISVSRVPLHRTTSPALAAAAATA